MLHVLYIPLHTLCHNYVLQVGCVYAKEGAIRGVAISLYLSRHVDTYVATSIEKYHY